MVQNRVSQRDFILTVTGFVIIIMGLFMTWARDFLPLLSSNTTPIISVTSPTSTTTTTPTLSATTTKTKTNTPSPTVTIPTATLTPTPTVTTDVTVTAVVSQFTLISPSETNTPFSTDAAMDFTWSWSEPLAPDTGFELLVWPDGAGRQAVHDSSQPEKIKSLGNNQYGLTLLKLSQIPGFNPQTTTYHWQVRLVRLKPNLTGLGIESSEGTFTVVPPTPTAIVPKPIDTSTPTPTNTPIPTRFPTATATREVVIQASLPVVTLISPENGHVFAPADVITLQWRWDGQPLAENQYFFVEGRFSGNDHGTCKPDWLYYKWTKETEFVLDSWLYDAMCQSERQLTWTVYVAEPTLLDGKPNLASGEGQLLGEKGETRQLTWTYVAGQSGGGSKDTGGSSNPDGGGGVPR